MYSVVLFILFLAPSPELCCDSTNYLFNNFRLIKLHYENSSGEKGLTTFIYDENEIINKAYWQLIDGSRSSENYYTYNEEENLIKKYREFSDGITSTQSYKYDQKENLISEHFNRSDGVTGTTDYKYDKDEKLVKAICSGLAGWFYGTIIYEYDVNGRKFKGIIEKDEKQVGTINFEYDTAGNLLKEYWEFQDSWSQTFIYEYEEVKRD
jgi:YD repeat-containing protein